MSAAGEKLPGILDSSSVRGVAKTSESNNRKRERERDIHIDSKI